MEILTTHIVQGRNIVEYKGFVTARNVRSLGAVRSFFTSFRDFFSGRSASYQGVMNEMENEVILEISQEAKQLGANAIIGFHLDIENIGSRNTAFVMTYAKGTAVILE